VGMHTSYLPDLEIDGVVLVDLDKDAIFVPQNTEIHPLPPNRARSLLKHLSKKVGDTTVPMKEPKLEEKAVQQIFLKFHVKIMKTYRNYLEAPSEYVVEKFQKAKFLQNHINKCPFLEAFLDTQMFQCFVDDRYVEQPEGEGRFQVLLFNEYIDKSEGKATPFLSDTSQNHDLKNKRKVMAPNEEGLDGKKFKYDAFPTLNQELAYPVRKPEVLAEDTSVRTIKVSHSDLSMKFFMEKRLFAQHFHTLNARTTKQNLAFTDFLHYFKKAQSLDEKSTRDFEEFCNETIDKSIIETGTTLDATWNSIKSYVSNQLQEETSAYTKRS